ENEPPPDAVDSSMFPVPAWSVRAAAPVREPTVTTFAATPSAMCTVCAAAPVARLIVRAFADVKSETVAVPASRVKVPVAPAAVRFSVLFEAPVHETEPVGKVKSPDALPHL